MKLYNYLSCLVLILSTTLIHAAEPVIKVTIDANKTSFKSFNLATIERIEKIHSQGKYAFAEGKHNNQFEFFDGNQWLSFDMPSEDISFYRLFPGAKNTKQAWILGAGRRGETYLSQFDGLKWSEPHSIREALKIHQDFYISDVYQFSTPTTTYLLVTGFDNEDEQDKTYYSTHLKQHKWRPAKTIIGSDTPLVKQMITSADDNSSLIVNINHTNGYYNRQSVFKINPDNQLIHLSDEKEIKYFNQFYSNGRHIVAWYDDFLKLDTYLIKSIIEDGPWIEVENDPIYDLPDFYQFNDTNYIQYNLSDNYFCTTLTSKNDTTGRAACTDLNEKDYRWQISEVLGKTNRYTRSYLTKVGLFVEEKSDDKKIILYNQNEQSVREIELPELVINHHSQSKRAYLTDGKIVECIPAYQGNESGFHVFVIDSLKEKKWRVFKDKTIEKELCKFSENIAEQPSSDKEFWIYQTNW